jgi:hypothetical protein
MEKLSGLVLDIYDDPAGEVLKTVFPTLDDVPELVKTAQQLTPEMRGRLPDDAFALILEQNGSELKKFATIDAGNTALSVEYFLKTGHKLPVEAQKVAAHNLCVACGWFGIEPPGELRKIAGKKIQLWPKALLKELSKRYKKPVYEPRMPLFTEEILKRNPGSFLGGGPKKIKQGSAEVTVSRVPKVRERQLEALKSRGIEGPTKTAMTKKAIGALPLMMGALVVPGAAGEAKKNLQARKGMGGAVVTPEQLKIRRQQMGLI